jgi:hypothetical protein
MGGVPFCLYTVPALRAALRACFAGFCFPFFTVCNFVALLLTYLYDELIALVLTKPHKVVVVVVFRINASSIAGVGS